MTYKARYVRSGDVMSKRLRIAKVIGGFTASVVVYMTVACQTNWNSLQAIRILTTEDVLEFNVYPRLGRGDVIRIAEKDDLKQMISWLKTAAPPQYVGSYPEPAEVMVIILRDGSVVRLKVGGPGFGYVPIRMHDHFLVANEYPDLKPLGEWRKSMLDQRKAIERGE